MYECKRPEVKYYYNYGTVGWKTFVGSLIFYAVVLNASATTFTSTDSELQEMILICLTYGLTLFAVKGVVGRYAGYVNPAQIINDAIYGDEFVRYDQAVFAFLACTAGAIIGFLLGFLTKSEDAMLSTLPQTTDLDPWEPFVIELVGGFIFSAVANSVAAKYDHTLATGVALFMAMLFTYSKTGGIINPHRYNSVLVPSLFIEGTSVFEIFDFIGYEFGSTVGILLFSAIDTRLSMPLPKEDDKEY